MYSPHTTNPVATDRWSICQLNTYVQVCTQLQKLQSSMCLRIASLAGGIIFVHVRVLSAKPPFSRLLPREASAEIATKFASPFSTQLNSSSVDTLLMLNNNTASQPGQFQGVHINFLCWLAFRQNSLTIYLPEEVQLPKPFSTNKLNRAISAKKVPFCYLSFIFIFTVIR